MKTDDGRVEYDITVATVNHVNMKATVPLYVCMYGFRSTGNVVTPTKDAYQLRNYSTIDKNSRTYIADIVKVTHYSRIYDADHSNDELFSIAYDATSKTYTYWYSDPSTTQVGSSLLSTRPWLMSISTLPVSATSSTSMASGTSRPLVL